MKIKLFTRWLVLGLLSVQCTLAAADKKTDAELTALIVGTWTADDIIDGDTMRFQKTYAADGTANATYSLVIKSPGGEQVRQVGQSTSKWKVEGGYLVTYDHHTVPPDVVPPDKIFRDRIIRVDDKDFVIFDTEGQAEDAKHRVAGK